MNFTKIAALFFAACMFSSQLLAHSIQSDIALGKQVSPTVALGKQVSPNVALGKQVVVPPTVAGVRSGGGSPIAGGTSTGGSPIAKSTNGGSPLLVCSATPTPKCEVLALIR